MSTVHWKFATIFYIEMGIFSNNVLQQWYIQSCMMLIIIQVKPVQQLYILAVNYRYFVTCNDINFSSLFIIRTLSLLCFVSTLFYLDAIVGWIVLKRSYSLSLVKSHILFSIMCGYTRINFMFLKKNTNHFFYSTKTWQVWRNGYVIRYTQFSAL